MSFMIARFFSLAIVLGLISSCGMPTNIPGGDSLASANSVETPKLPMDTSGTGPALSEKEDSVLFANAPKTFIVKRVEAWRYDEKFGKEKRELELSQTFYGGGVRVDSTFLTYDGKGRLYEVNKYAVNGLQMESNSLFQGARSDREVESYDKHNNLVTVNYFDVEAGKKEKLTPSYSLDGKIFENTYNEKGLLISKKETSVHGKVTAEYTYTYDAAGNQLSEVGYAAYDNGDTSKYDTHCEYNAKNQLIKKDYNGGILHGITNFEYDDAGKKIRDYSSNVSTSYYYDKKGNLVLEHETSSSGESFLKYNWIYYKQ